MSEMQECAMCKIKSVQLFECERCKSYICKACAIMYDPLFCSIVYCRKCVKGAYIKNEEVK